MKEQQTEALNKLKTICNDTHFAEELLDRIISLQKQMDVEATEIIVPVKEVIKEYSFGAFTFIRCKTCVIFKSTGYRVIVRPYLKALYDHIISLLDMKDNEEKLSPEAKEVMEGMLNITILALSMPLDFFVNEDYMFNVANYVTNQKYEMYRKISETVLKEETEQDVIANEDFKQDALESEKVREEESNA